MATWLQYLNLAVAVLCILGLCVAAFYWRRLSALLVELIAICKQIVPLLRDMAKITKILERLEGHAEEGRLANDLLKLGVEQVSQEASKVAADLRMSHEEAHKIKDGRPGEAADAAAQLSPTEKTELAAEVATKNILT